MIKTQQVETYCFFTDAPKFTPMFNPTQMFAYGIHEGVALTNDYGMGLRVDGFVQEWIKKGFLKGINPLKLASKPLIHKNYYKVMEAIPPSMPGGFMMDSVVWLEWYIRFYYGNRITRRDNIVTNDENMIDWWRHVVLWGMGEEAPKSAATDQLLLHYSWNPGWEPTLLKTSKPR